MGTITDQFANVYRDYNTDGVPASGAHEPVKSEIRALGAALESAIANGSLGSVDVAYSTRALLNADLAWPAGSTALVYADPTAANNDIYVKTGASGAGAWTLTTILHDSVSVVAQPYVDAAEAAAADATANFGDPPAPSEIAVIDAKGRAAAYWTAAGAFTAPQVLVGSINGIVAGELERRLDRTLRPSPADMLGVILYGQSKSLGGGGLSTFAADIPNAFMFNANGSTKAGPRAQEGGGTVAQNHASLIPFAEKFNNTNGNAETGLGQFCRMLDFLVRRENGVSLDDLGVELICSAPGYPNLGIDALDKGTAHYQRVIDDVTYGASLAAAAGKSYAVPAVLWAQGEYDIQYAGTSRAVYKAKLKQLRLDLDADIKAITGQSLDVALILYSTTMYVQTNCDIALAQQDAAAEDSHIVFSHPDYSLPHASPTDTHYHEMGYAIAGSYFARAFKRYVLDGSTDKVALRQSGEITRTGNVLSVPFSVPFPPLVADSEYFPPQTNHGFYCAKVGGAENAITAITVLHDRVRIALTSAEAGTLYYGHGSTWGGNLHDSDSLDAQTFVRRKMANCAIVFEKSFN